MVVVIALGLLVLLVYLFFFFYCLCIDLVKMSKVGALPLAKHERATHMEPWLWLQNLEHATMSGFLAPTFFFIVSRGWLMAMETLGRNRLREDRAERIKESMG